MKQLIISLLVLLSAVTVGKGQITEPSPVGASTSIIFLGAIADTFNIRCNFVSAQGYTVDSINVGDLYAVEYGLSTPKSLAVFSIKTIIPVSGSQREYALVKLTPGTLLSFPTNNGVFIATDNSHQLLTFDGNNSDNLKAYITNSNAIKIDKLLTELSARVDTVVGGAAISLNKLYVSKFGGNNATAERGNILKPYADPWTAKYASAPGDIIHVLDGEWVVGVDVVFDTLNFDSVSLLVDKVDFVWDKGTKLTSTSTLFYDTLGVQCQHTGHLNIHAPTITDMNTIRIDHPNSRVKIELDSLVKDTLLAGYYASIREFDKFELDIDVVHDNGYGIAAYSVATDTIVGGYFDVHIGHQVKNVIWSFVWEPWGYYQDVVMNYTVDYSDFTFTYNVIEFSNGTGQAQNVTVNIDYKNCIARTNGISPRLFALGTQLSVAKGLEINVYGNYKFLDGNLRLFVDYIQRGTAADTVHYRLKDLSIYQEDATNLSWDGRQAGNPNVVYTMDNISAVAMKTPAVKIRDEFDETYYIFNSSFMTYADTTVFVLGVADPDDDTYIFNSSFIRNATNPKLGGKVFDGAGTDTLYVAGVYSNETIQDPGLVFIEMTKHPGVITNTWLKTELEAGNNVAINVTNDNSTLSIGTDYFNGIGMLALHSSIQSTTVWPYDATNLSGIFYHGKKYAIRGGYASTGTWTEANIGEGTVVLGGYDNTASDFYGGIFAGYQNTVGVDGESNVILGGANHSIIDPDATYGFNVIAGGQTNSISAPWSAIIAGNNNVLVDDTDGYGINGIYNSESSTINGGYSTIIGGGNSDINNNSFHAFMANVQGSSITNADGGTIIATVASSIVNGENTQIYGGQSNNIVNGTRTTIIGGTTLWSNQTDAVTIGHYNDTTGYALNQVLDLFVIGDGTSGVATSNAFTVRSNGDVILNNYGDGSKAATPTYALGVDVNGKAVTFSAAGDGNGIISALPLAPVSIDAATNGLTITNAGTTSIGTTGTATGQFIVSGASSLPSTLSQIVGADTSQVLVQATGGVDLKTTRYVDVQSDSLLFGDLLIQNVGAPTFLQHNGDGNFEIFSYDLTPTDPYGLRIIHTSPTVRQLQLGDYRGDFLGVTLNLNDNAETATLSQYNEWGYHLSATEALMGDMFYDGNGNGIRLTKDGMAYFGDPHSDLTNGIIVDNDNDLDDFRGVYIGDINAFGDGLQIRVENDNFSTLSRIAMGDLTGIYNNTQFIIDNLNKTVEGGLIGTRSFKYDIGDDDFNVRAGEGYWTWGTPQNLTSNPVDTMNNGLWIGRLQTLIGYSAGSNWSFVAANQTESKLVYKALDNGNSNSVIKVGPNEAAMRINNETTGATLWQYTLSNTGFSLNRDGFSIFSGGNTDSLIYFYEDKYALANATPAAGEENYHIWTDDGPRMVPKARFLNYNTGGGATSVAAATPERIDGDTGGTNTIVTETGGWDLTTTGGRATWAGTDTVYVNVRAKISSATDDVSQMYYYIAKNGTIIATSRGRRDHGNNDYGSISVEIDVELIPTDYLEVWCEPVTGTETVTISSMQFVGEVVEWR